MLKLQTKKWGNSLGVIIPAKTVKELKLKEHEQIVIDIRNKNQTVLQEMFGALPTKKDTSHMLKEARKEMESKWGL